MAMKIMVPRQARVLVLEDSPERIAWFKQHLPDARYVATVTDAILAMASDKHYDVLFLDHDLGGTNSHGYNETGPGCGEDVARHILDSGYVADSVVIHSWNPVGAANMARHLPGAVLARFGTFEIGVANL
jgi:CheY-like chemotaxis protein